MKLFRPCITAIAIFLGGITLIIGVIISFSYFHYHRGYQSVLQSDRNTIISALSGSQIIREDTGYSRRTGNTLMSIPEWYIVTLSDDYTQWLEQGKNPSDFPYISYLCDYWSMYGKITAMMDGVIPHDEEYHTMVRVIGLSTTLEFGLKALYENTMGRLTSFQGYNTSEDRYYTSSSRRYVRFILLKPWYLFDYTAEKDNFHLQSYSLRSLERYGFYMMEFFIKKQYASLIEKATRSAYAVPDIWTFVRGDIGASSGSFVLNEDVRSVSGGVLISRYYPFTQQYPKISHSLQTHTIAGNASIVVEGTFRDAIPPRYQSILLFSFPNYIGIPGTRDFLYIPVEEINALIATPGFTLRHIYDF